MSDAKPAPSGPERRWRKEQPANFKSIERTGRIAFLAIGAVLLASVIVGSWWWFGREKPTSLHCYPYGSYDNPLLSPAPWFFQDAAQLYKTFRVSEKKNDKSLTERSFLIPDLEKLKEETVIIYIAGRGIARNNKAYVLPSNATDDPSSWLELGFMIEAIKKCSATHKLLLLDIASTSPSLYTGPLQDSIADVIDAYLTSESPPFPVLTSCSKGETSNVMAVTGTSVFGYYLNQAMQGLANGFGGDNKNQEVTVNEVVSFVNTRVKRWVALNLGQTQTPTRYGPKNINFKVVHRHNVEWLDAVPLPAAPPAPADESTLPDKEKLVRKETREKEQKEADQKRLDAIFPNALKKGWEIYDPWLAALMQQKSRTDEHREYPLRLATLNRFAHHLRQYEEALMLFNNSVPGGESQENQQLSTNFTLASNRAVEALNQIDIDTRPKHNPHSITALWPRNWVQSRTERPKDIPKPLVNAYETLFSSVPGNPPGAAKPEGAPDIKPFMAVVNGKEDEKKPGQPCPLEALFLCWDSLCEDDSLNLEKLKLTQTLMNEILRSEASGEKLRDKLDVHCNELDLLKWIVEQSQGDSEWNFVSSKEHTYVRELEQKYFSMIHNWLKVEYLAERCGYGYYPDGIGFVERQKMLDSLLTEQQTLVNKMLSERKHKTNRLKSSELQNYASQLNALSLKYATCLNEMGQEREVLNAWWDAVAILQATAEMMVSEDDATRWLQWDKLADQACQLVPFLESRSSDPTARDFIEKVYAARQDLTKSFNELTNRLIQSATLEGNELELSRSIDRVLKTSLLRSDVRRELHGMLIKLQLKNHLHTLQVERRDEKGIDIGETRQVGLGSEARAKRRADISRQLLRLGGLSQMDKTFHPPEEDLRRGWSKDLPERLGIFLQQSKWLPAARIEAVLPQTEKTDALLKWRLGKSGFYLEWLDKRQQQLNTRQLHLADPWK